MGRSLESCGGITGAATRHRTKQIRLSFINILAFWTGKFRARIDRLPRRSGLMREKWDFGAAETYGHRTIRKAIEAVDNCYSPLGVKQFNDPSIADVAVGQKGSEKPVTTTDRPLNVNGIPAWPNDVMAGGAGLFARTYAKYQESPEPFHFMGYLTSLAYDDRKKITLGSLIQPQPRLFTVLLGESADDRKSTAIGNVRSLHGGVSSQ